MCINIVILRDDGSTGQLTKALDKAEDNLRELKDCVVCMETDRQRDTVLLPCKHLATCSDCAATLNKCPVCRAAIHDRIKVQFP